MEQWKKIKDHGYDYSVSNLARIRNDKTQRILSIKPNRFGRVVARLSSNGKSIRRIVSRLVAEAFIGPINNLEVDHIDNDPTNNRVDNLRIVTRSENHKAARRTPLGASSVFRGVSFREKENKFIAYIRTSGVLIYLGSFDNELDAARIRDAKAVELGWPKETLNMMEL